MLNTFSSVTPTALTNTSTDKITLLRQNCQRHLVLNSTNSTVSSFKLFVCLMTASTFCCSNAVRTGLHNASVSPSRNTASLRARSIPRCVSALLAMLRG
jgi:hypothetical protein